jgi:hypothetical protein
VAASSNFPVAFAPLTLDIYNREACGPLPGWIDPALKEAENPTRRYYDARSAVSYRDPARSYAHLLDGGLSDNLGLRGPYQAVTTTDSAWSILAQTGRIERLMVIVANAKTTKHRSWDKSSNPPNIIDVLDVVTSGPMDDVTLDSIQMTADHFDYMKQLSDTVDACNTKLRKACPSASPIPNPITAKFAFVELSFDRIRDDRLRRCLEELPTTFSLPKNTVDLLRVSAAQLLMTSEAFIEAMHDLDSTWTPSHVAIDPKLVDAVCSP